jgi:hypothetical protein
MLGLRKKETMIEKSVKSEESRLLFRQQFNDN